MQTYNNKMNKKITKIKIQKENINLYGLKKIRYQNK